MLNSWFLNGHREEVSQLTGRDIPSTKVPLHGENANDIRDLGYGWFAINPSGWAVINPLSSEKFITMGVGGALPIILDREDGMRVALYELRGIGGLGSGLVESALLNYHSRQQKPGLSPIIAASIYGIIPTDWDDSAIKSLQSTFGLSRDKISINHFALPSPNDTVAHRYGRSLLAYDGIIVNNFIAFYRVAEQKNPVMFKLSSRSLLQKAVLLAKSFSVPHLDVKPIDTFQRQPHELDDSF